MKEVLFLGHIISKDGVLVDPSKVVAVMEWIYPKNVTEVKSFLELARYYHKFIRDFFIIAIPLTSLTKKVRNLHGIKNVRTFKHYNIFCH